MIAARNNILRLKMQMAKSKAKTQNKVSYRPSIKALEGGYHADLRSYVKALIDARKQHVDPLIDSLVSQAARERQDGADVRNDTYLDTLQSAIAKAADQVDRLFPDSVLKSFARRQAAKVDRFAGDNLTRDIRAVAEVDVTTSTPGIARRIEDFTTDNVRMIKALSTGYYDRVQATVTANIRSGSRASSPSDRTKGWDQDLEDGDQITENRAALIARDQTNKFNGEVTRARQSDLGITEYVWHNSDDERVRGNPGGLYPKARYSHWDREGRVYSWADPPDDGHPGHAVNCRCWAEPVIPGF